MPQPRSHREAVQHPPHHELTDPGVLFHASVRALVYASGGLVGVLVGALVGAVLLVTLSGALVLWVLLDALFVRARRPRVAIEAQRYRVPESATVPVDLTLEGVSSSSQIRVALDSGFAIEEGSNVFTPETGQAQRGEKALLLEAQVRGPQHVGPASVRAWSPARHWSLETRLADLETVEVIPRRVDVEDVAVASRVLKPFQGRFDLNQPGQGMDFFNLREYQSGDTIRSVNWKASARAGELIVNQRERETQGEVLFLLDMRDVSGVGPAGKTPLDRGCRLVLSLFEEAVGARDIVRFRAYGEDVLEGPHKGEPKVHAMEEILASLPPGGDTSLVSVWKQVRTEMQSTGPIFIVTSGEAEPGLPRVVQDMVARGHPVSVLSPEPVGPYWDGPAYEDRRRARAETLDAARENGAIVFDWALDAPAEARAPAIHREVSV